MKNQLHTGLRGQQILKLLSLHGPLSTRTLSEIIDPPMKLRRMNDATKRLFDHGFIVRRFESLPKNASNFFQLSQRRESREFIGKILGISANELLQPQFRNQELLHSELCAIWSSRLKKIFPDCRVVRDYHFADDRLAGKVLLSGKNEVELKPDILIHFGAGDLKSITTTIAIEIERTLKTKERLFHKLRKLTSRTQLDGVIYVCGKNSIAESLRHIYKSRIVEKSHRIKQYGTNFLLFTDGSQHSDGSGPRLFNTSLKPVLLRNWISFLTSTARPLRRDFNLGGQPTSAAQ
jgi:hypothetical protein